MCNYFIEITLILKTIFVYQFKMSINEFFKKNRFRVPKHYLPPTQNKRQDKIDEYLLIFLFLFLIERRMNKRSNN